MKATKITKAELDTLGISALPSRPTAPKALGGGGYTAHEMKAAFDRLPALVAERLNLLIDAIQAVGEDSLASAIPTGIAEGHTLNDLFVDVESGDLASYISVHGTTLAIYLATLRHDLDACMALIGVEGAKTNG